ncbi:hypothetical protein [Phycicoccus jejuensis]|uniref:hypothetical protein n=1 Tax=Phycicoccus jejuensis TaxID=367299 RepID=UPI0012FC420F|nr:hypothetical protein [Phycicoccus jejuensis]
MSTDASIVAAWIAAGAALAAAGVAYWSSREQVSRQNAFEREQSRLLDLRTTYRSFMAPAEKLVDLLDQYIHVGEISRYEIALELTSAVAELVPESAPGMVPPNPIPELDPQSHEAVTLRQLTGAMRTQRVMVDLVGPDDVASAALAFERSMRRAAGAVLSRDAAGAADSFMEMVGDREKFLAAAKDVTRHG